MSEQERKFTHRALMAPGKPDRGPWPPIGQLAFEKVTSMSEDDIDRAFFERHGLENVFEKDADESEDEATVARRLELKRIIFARLEGYSPAPNAELDLWYRSMNRGQGSVAMNASQLAKILTTGCKNRIDEVRRYIAREAAILRPTAEVQALSEKIREKFIALGMEPVTIEELFDAEQLPPHKLARDQNSSLDLPNLLEILLMRLEGRTLRECADRFGTERGVISGTISARMSATAKEAIVKANG